MKHDPRWCVLACFVSATLACSTTMIIYDGRHTREMPIDEALRLARYELTPGQIHNVAGVLHRHAASIARSLVDLAKRDDLAGAEATEAISHIKEILK